MALVSTQVQSDDVLFTGVFGELHRRLEREQKEAMKTLARRERLRKERAKIRVPLPQSSNATSKISSDRKPAPLVIPISSSRMAVSFLDVEMSDYTSSEEDENNYDCYSEGSDWLRRNSNFRTSRKIRGLPLQKVKMGSKINGCLMSDPVYSRKASLKSKAPRERRMSNKAVPISLTVSDQSKLPTKITNLTLPSSAGMEEKPQSSDSITKVIRSQVLFNEQIRHREKQLEPYRQLESELAPLSNPTDIVSQLRERFRMTMARFTKRLETKAKAQFKQIKEDREKIENAICEAFQEQDDQVLEWEKHWKMNRRYIECGLKYPVNKFVTPKKTKAHLLPKKKDSKKDNAGKSVLPTKSATMPAPSKSNAQRSTDSDLKSLFTMSNLNTPTPPHKVETPPMLEFSESVPKLTPLKPPLSLPTAIGSPTTTTKAPFFQSGFGGATSVPTSVPVSQTGFGDNSSKAADILPSAGVFEAEALDVPKDSKVWNWKNRAKKIKKIYDNAESIIAKAKASNPRGLKRVSLKVRKIFAQLSTIQSAVIEKNRDINQLYEEHPELKEALICRTAKELVSKAETAMTKNNVYAFAYLAFTQTRKNKQFLKLFLCYLATKCPFVIPAIQHRNDFESDDEWYTELGFIEKHDVPRDKAIDNNFAVGETKIFEHVLSYLNRVGSYVQLYAAFLQITPNKGEQHPHDMAYCWIWLVRVLNHPPTIGTAHALHSFLRVVSYQMIRTFPVQFKKLLAFLRKDYLARLPQETNEMKFGYNKLVNLLEEYNTTGIKKPPETLFGNKVTTGAVD